MDINKLPGMGYVTAKKSLRHRGYLLFWVGTSNEVYPGEVFKSSREARQFHAVQLVKGNAHGAATHV